jgi:hypothetical protein
MIDVQQDVTSSFRTVIGREEHVRATEEEVAALQEEETSYLGEVIGRGGARWKWS